jgi:hypothetical protein
MSATIAFIVPAVAAAGRLAAANHAVDDGSGTANAFVHLKRIEGAIADTRPAFHAPVPVQNDCLPFFHGKDPARAYLDAHSAADTTAGKEFKSWRIREILHMTLHSPSL